MFILKDNTFFSRSCNLNKSKFELVHKTTIMNDKRSLIVCFMVVGYIPISMGTLKNSPCKKTSDWSHYDLSCPTNHTIYITKHVIEDVFNRLLHPALGCSASDAFYCGGELPINNTINLKNNDVFESAVNACNGRTECTLNKDYFLKAETSVRISCNDSKRPELKSAQFRQSVDYECIQDSLKINMCLSAREVKNHYSHLYLKTSSASCSCHITGSVSRLKILQTTYATVLIQSNEINIFEHQHADVGLYGVDISIQAENLVITIMNGSTTSFALIKVFGNYSTICKKYGTLSTTSLYNMTFESTKFPVLSSDRGHTHDDMSSLSTTNNTTDEVATTGTAESIFSSMTGRELTASDLIEIFKSWILTVIGILAVFVSLVIFLICFYFIKQRKDRILLLTILQRLNDGYTNTDDSHFKTTKLLKGPSRLSDDDPNYQEISNNLLKNPNTKQHTNPGYNTECKSETAIIGQDDAGGTSIDDNKYFELEKRDPNVMDEFRKSI